MDFFEPFMVDAAVFEKYSGKNEYNEKQYEAPTQISCWIQSREQVRESPFSEEVSCLDVIFTTTEVSIFDKIDGRYVLEIKKFRSSILKNIWGWRVTF